MSSALGRRNFRAKNDKKPPKSSNFAERSRTTPKEWAYSPKASTNNWTDWTCLPTNAPFHNYAIDIYLIFLNTLEPKEERCIIIMEMEEESPSMRNRVKVIRKIGNGCQGEVFSVEDV